MRDIQHMTIKYVIGCVISGPDFVVSSSFQFHLGKWYICLQELNLNNPIFVLLPIYENLRHCKFHLFNIFFEILTTTRILCRWFLVSIGEKKIMPFQYVLYTRFSNLPGADAAELYACDDVRGLPMPLTLWVPETNMCNWVINIVLYNGLVPYRHQAIM